MDEFRKAKIYSESRLEDLIGASRRAREAQGIGGGPLHRTVIALTIILIGMIAWWGR